MTRASKPLLVPGYTETPRPNHGTWNVPWDTGHLSPAAPAYPDAAGTATLAGPRLVPQQVFLKELEMHSF